MADDSSEPTSLPQQSPGEPAGEQSRLQAEPEAQKERPRLYGRLLWLACVVASILVTPYEIAFLKQTGDKPTVESLWPRIAEGLAETALVSMLIIALGLACGKSVGLGWPPLDGWGNGPENRLRRRAALKLALILAVAAAGFDVILSVIVQMWGDINFNILPPPWWASLLASIGAGISEEIWLRLGVMSFFVWVGAKLIRQTSPGATVIWIGNLFACLIFGALHLPQAARLTGHLSGQLVSLALIGNGVPGLMFGWLYWRKGLIAAMTCHATTDIIVKVILPLLGF
jgi:hypothetical protein